MTRKERLEAIIQGRIPDRPAVKLWGAEPGQACLHPAFAPVRDLAVHKTELMLYHSQPFNIYCGAYCEQLVEQYREPTSSPDWVDEVTLFHTPDGDLRSVFSVSTRNMPGYEKEYLLKEPDDLKKLQSLPYQPYPVSADGFHAAERKLQDAGIVMYGLDEAMHALQRLIGSENFAVWSLEEPELLEETIHIFGRRLRRHAEASLQAGIRGVYGYVGPELCIPPLMSPAAFETYVFDVDRQLNELIHDGGSWVWVHCHGRVRNFLSRFVAMGVDLLNPVEPPPMGDVELDEAFAIVGDRMGLEGNIETHDFIAGSREALCEKIHAAIDAGRGKRLVVCPSSSYMGNANPSPAEIRNWLFYIEEAVRYAESLCV